MLDLCAWAHGEWVRIHPLTNGNGRTARLWANSLLVRYGLPPVIGLRPRPGGGYGAAGAAAMRGDVRPTRVELAKMLTDFLERSAPEPHQTAAANPPPRKRPATKR